MFFPIVSLLLDRKVKHRPLSIVDEIQQILDLPVNFTHTDNDLISYSTAESLGRRLALFHFLTGQPLTKKAFEYQLANALTESGVEAIVAESGTIAGADLLLQGGGVRLSLKTEGAKNTSRTSVTVSKLMEARWIRDCDDEQAFYRGLETRLVPHLEAYDRVLNLRSFPIPQTNDVYYELLELPLKKILLIKNREKVTFSEVNTSGGITATVCDEEGPVCKFTCDGSVEKITLRGLSVERCLKHATWTIPLAG